MMGAELQVQNMTVMPNFRLSETDARDIATYLFRCRRHRNTTTRRLWIVRNSRQGHALIKQYGCAGCHEIKALKKNSASARNDC